MVVAQIDDIYALSFRADRRGHCRECRRRIDIGEQVNYDPVYYLRHTACLVDLAKYWKSSPTSEQAAGTRPIRFWSVKKKTGD